MNKTAKILLTVGGIVGLLVIFTYLSMSPNEVSCEACIEFHGNTECRKASGKDQMEAETAAVSTACGIISGGVTDGIACRNTVPKSVTCTSK
jgi:hypothetical protein